MLLHITHNGFHGWTKVAVRVAENPEPGKSIPISYAVGKRINAECCGNSDCCCGESIAELFLGYLPETTYATIYIPCDYDGSGQINMRGAYPQA